MKVTQSCDTLDVKGMQKVIQKVQTTKDSSRNRKIARLSRDRMQVCENDPPQESAKSAKESWDVFKRQLTESENRPNEKRTTMKCTTSNEPATMLQRSLKVWSVSEEELKNQ